MSFSSSHWQLRSPHFTGCLSAFSQESYNKRIALSDARVPCRQLLQSESPALEDSIDKTPGKTSRVRLGLRIAIAHRLPAAGIEFLM
jgi:hypothetical protein